MRPRTNPGIKPGPMDGLLRSRVFPSLWLDARALFSRDKRAFIGALEAGLASLEHADFARKLSG
jgi:hypothetical protein